MRKRNIEYIFEKLMWFLIYMFPMLLALVFYANAEMHIPLSTLMGEYIVMWGDGPIFTAIQYICENYLQSISHSPFIVNYLAYVVEMSIIHVVVDILKFLPDLAHDLMEKCKK